VFVSLLFLFLLYCFVLCLSFVYFKFALMVFNVRPGRCLDVKKNVLSKELIVVVANKSLVVSTQQMNHSHVVSLTNFKNPYS
jgi:hypothetical protein